MRVIGARLVELDHRFAERENVETRRDPGIAGSHAIHPEPQPGLARGECAKRSAIRGRDTAYLASISAGLVEIRSGSESRRAFRPPRCHVVGAHAADGKHERALGQYRTPRTQDA